MVVKVVRNGSAHIKYYCRMMPNAAKVNRWYHPGSLSLPRNRLVDTGWRALKCRFFRWINVAPSHQEILGYLFALGVFHFNNIPNPFILSARSNPEVIITVRHPSVGPLILSMISDQTWLIRLTGFVLCISRELRFKINWNSKHP